ncbi:MAG: glycoside hydrolase family 3 protein, partial [Cyclobacteriaceae bacterium]
MRNWKVGLTLILIFAIAFSSSLVSPPTKKLPPFLNQGQEWVDSVFNTMSPDERIAQLFMVAAYSNRDSKHEAAITRLIEEYKIGGLVFFQGGPLRQAAMTNRYQAKSKVPLLIAMDAEWGLGMRLDSTINFPYQMTLGAIADNDLIYDMGVEIAREFKRLGAHISFSPVVDVNNNPKNPVINYRAFGENREQVTAKGVAYMKGLQDQGVMAVAKHFPGHGDTDTDSHNDLPVIPHQRTRLDSVELHPFVNLVENGVGGVMVAHMSIPSLDATENLPSTLSKPIVEDLLKKELGYSGLIFTDALNMKGVTKHFPPGEVDVKALIAGNDVLVFTQDVPLALKKIKEAIKKGTLSQKDIDRRCKKVLAAKFWAGLS